MKIIKYFLQFIVIITLFLIFKLIGYRNASNLGSKIGNIFGKFIRSDKIILKNLSIIENYTGNKIDDEKKIVNNVFSNYGRILSEYVYLSKFKGSLKKNITLIGENNLREIKQKNKKVIFVSGHFNNFELMAMQIEKAGIELATIYRPLNNVFLNRTMEKIRTENICKNQIKKGRAGSREIIKNVKNGKSIAIMIDQRVREGEKVNFFNHLATTTTIPAQLIKKYNCELVPVYIERIRNNYFKMFISKPIKINNKKSIIEITKFLNDLLERMILKNIDQWIWTHNRWKD